MFSRILTMYQIIAVILIPEGGKAMPKERLPKILSLMAFKIRASFCSFKAGMHNPRSDPKHVMSGPRSRLKIQETSPE